MRVPIKINTHSQNSFKNHTIPPQICSYQAISCSILSANPLNIEIDEHIDILSATNYHDTDIAGLNIHLSITTKL